MNSFIAYLILLLLAALFIAGRFFFMRQPTRKLRPPFAPNDSTAPNDNAETAYLGLSKKVTDKRPPHGTKTSLLVNSSHWREEFMGSIAWIEGQHDPSKLDFINDYRVYLAYEAEALRSWQFLGSAYWHDMQIMQQHHQQMTDDFKQAVEAVLADFRAEGWQVERVNAVLYHLHR